MKKDGKRSIEWHLFGLILSIMSLALHFLLGENAVVGWILALICFVCFVYLISGGPKIITFLSLLLTVVVVPVLSFAIMNIAGDPSLEFAYVFQVLCMLLPSVKFIGAIIMLFNPTWL